MTDSKQRIRFPGILAAIILALFCFFAKSATAQQPANDNTAPFTDIFTVSEQETTATSKDESAGSSIIPALLFLSVVFMGTTGQHYYKQYQSYQNKLAGLENEYQFLMAQLITVDTSQAENDLNEIDALKQQLDLKEKELFNLGEEMT